MTREIIELVKLAKKTKTMPTFMFAINTVENDYLKYNGIPKPKEEIIRNFHQELVKTGKFTGLNFENMYLQTMNNWKLFKNVKNT